MWQSLLLVVCLVGSAYGYLGNYYCQSGRDVVVHLFEYKWNDIAARCPSLAAAGYCAVQVSPPSEHVVLGAGPGNPAFPWWQRYQPVSYGMTSRSGNEQQFINMVQTCNNAGVYIYVDAVINHMTGGGSGIGSGGSSWSGDAESYPGVPYGPSDFHNHDHCPTASMEIEDYNDAVQVRNCRLVGLRDLRGWAGYVQEKTTEYLNKLINWGVAGFRVDAVKHMWPADLQVVYDNLNNLPTQWFPGGTRPYVYQEVIDLGGEAVGVGEYIGMARVTEFKYSAEIGNVFRKWNGQRLAYLQNFGEGWGMMRGMDALVFIDNHDNQRGHGPGGASILTYKDSRLYKMATAYKLAWAYGHVRVMSSYEFTDTEAGPPSDGNGNTNDVVCGFDGGPWVCEHQWRQIQNMVGFHNAALGQPVTNWWDNEWNAIAFGRNGAGFLIINNEDSTLDVTLQTGMPAGQYCDVISCETNRPPCGSCNTVTVNGDGTASFSIPNSWEDPMIAIHV